MDKGVAIMTNKRVQPISRSLGDLDDFFNQDGGIFERPAKVKFKAQPAGPNFEEVLQSILNNKTKDDAKATGIKQTTNTKILKLEALAQDPGATPGERANAKAAIKRLRG